MKKNPTRNVLTVAAVAMAILALTTTPACAELVVEEHFVYELLSLIDGQDGGFGFDGPWSASKSHGRDYVMQFGGLTFTDAHLEELAVEGNSLSRFGSAGRAEAHRTLSSASRAALTGDNTTIWFGLLVAAPSAHRWGSFHLGTYKFGTQGMPALGDGDDDRNPPFTPYSGEGFGLTLMTADSGAGDGTINALAFDDDSAPIVAEGTFTQTIQPGATHHDTSLIVGKINWKAQGTPDELFLFNVTDLSTEPAEEAAVASITHLDLDQTEFDTVAVWDTNNTIFDEIRFGTTFFDAVGKGPCPSKLSASGGPGGVTLAWVNGLEMPTSVRILRDTQEIANAAPVDPPTYTDADAQPGLIDYELIFAMPGEACGWLATTFDACITDLAATQSFVAGGVVLTWTRNLAYDGIEIRRDGEVIQASLDGTADSYTDAESSLGLVSYAVVPTNGTCDPAAVEIDVVEVRLELTPQARILPVGESVQLVAKAVGDGGLREDLTTAASGTVYTSDPAGIVSIDENGLLEAGAVGETTVTATNGVLSDTATVIVRGDFILVENSGFEEPVLPDGEFTESDGPYWKLGFYDVLVDPTLWIPGGEDGGVWNPDAVDGFSDSAAFAGQNTGWAISSLGIDFGLSQVLDATLEEDTEYTLSVQVGNAFYNESDETADYRMELLAGGVLLASDTDNSPLADTWELHSLTYNSTDNPEQVGEPLEIRLIAVEYVDLDGVDGYEVDFDEVTLTVSGDTQKSSFVRGDADSSGEINLTDGVSLLNFLFLGGPEPACKDAADVNDSGDLNLTDAVNIFNWLFLGGEAPKPPASTLADYDVGDCDIDPTADGNDADLGCETPAGKCF